MLVTIFTLQLGVPVQPRLVTVGRYDGRHPCLTCATAGGRVFVHNPHGDRSNTSIAFLHINKNITSLVAGRLDTSTQKDVLLVGTPTDVLAYDVFANKDLFFKELPDGVFAMCVGQVGNIPTPLVFLGGNCSIQGLNANAEDAFWTVTGDNVCSLALCDVDGDDGAELVVGSEDFDLRAFHADGEMIQETSHNEAVTALCTLAGRRFAFALASGSVGVYEGARRLWTSSRKQQVVCLHAFDCNLDGVAELVAGWSDGTVEVRDPRTGKVLFTDSMPSMIAGIVQADYRLDGTETLIVVSVEGELRGYQPMGFEPKPLKAGEPAFHPNVNSPLASPQSSYALSPQPLSSSSVGAAATLSTASTIAHADKASAAPTPQHAAVRRQQQQRQVQELTQAANDLKSQLKTLEALSKAAPGRAALPTAAANVSANFVVEDRPEGSRLAISFSAPGMLVRMAVLEGEGLFPTRHHVVVPPVPSTKLIAPLLVCKNQPATITAQLFIGTAENPAQSLVKELTLALPRFAGLRSSEQPARGGKLSLAVPASQLSKLAKWVNENFLLPSAMLSTPASLSFLSLDGFSPLTITTDGELTIISPDGDLAGDVLQSLAEFLGIEDLNSLADCPQEVEEFSSLLSKVNDFHAARQKLSANMADNSSLVKGLVVRAEDARIQGDMEAMKHAYTQLHDLNRDLVNAYNIRSNNHAELVASLKSLNTHIQRVGRWRVGKAKTATIAALREAIKNNDAAALVKVIKLGGSTA